MRGNRKATWFDRTVFVWVLLMLSILAYILLFLPGARFESARTTEQSVSFFEGWYSLRQGVTLPVSRKGDAHLDVRLDGSGSAVLVQTLKRKVPAGTYLTFRARVSFAEVLAGEKVLYSYSRSSSFTPADPQIMRFYRILLPELSPGDTLVIRLRTDDAAELPVSLILLGSLQDAYYYILHTQVLTLITCVCLAAFSLLEIALCVWYTLKRAETFRRASVWLGLLVLAASVWIACDSGLALLLIGSDLLYYFMEFLSLMVAPVFAQLYLYYNSSVGRTARFIVLADMAAILIVLSLDLCGIQDFERMRGVLHFMLAVALAHMTFQTLLGRNRQGGSFVFGLCTMVFSGFFGLALYYTHHCYPISYYPKFGMLVFSACMLFYTVKGAAKNAVMAKKTAVAEARADMAESELLLSQISSHFFYNTMNIIRGLIRIDTDAAYRLTGDFVKYLRSHVDAIHAKDGVQPFTSELDAVQAYTEVCKVKLNGNLTVEYDLQVMDFSMPALTLEPIVENAIRHGLFPKGGGRVTVSSAERPEGYEVTVSDDGVGYDTLTEGVGLTNVRQRLMSSGCSLTLESRPGKGTTARLMIAKKLEQKEIYPNENDVG